MLTDDPGTPGTGKWEINLAFSIEKDGEERLFEAPLLDVNYGVGDRIQLKYEIPWIVLHEQAETRNGMGNSLFGVKWRFADESRYGISASCYPQVEFNNRSSSARRGLVEEGTAILLPVELAGRIGSVEINAEFGYAFQGHRKDELIWGVVLGYPSSERLELLAEMWRTFLTGFHEAEVLSNVGVRWAMTEALTLIASGGFGLDGGPDAVGYAGVQVCF